MSGPISEPPVGSVTATNEEKPADTGDQQHRTATGSSSAVAGTSAAAQAGDDKGLHQQDMDKPPSTWRAGAPVPPGGVPLGGTSVPPLQLDGSGTQEGQTSARKAFDDPATRKVNLGWDCEREIDRLVREKLEGQNTDRTQLNRGVRQMAEYQQSWTGRIEDVCAGLGQTFLEGLYDGSYSLFRTVRQLEPACKKVVQAVPIVIYEDEDDNADGFNDLIAKPTEAAAAPAPKPAKQRKPKTSPRTTEAPSAEEQPKQDGAEVKEEKKEKPRRKKADNESALSASASMTSSAAKLLGGFNNGSGSKKSGDKKSDDAKSGDKEAASSSGTSTKKKSSSTAEDGSKPKKSSKEGGSGKSSSAKKGDESDRKSSATAATGSASAREGSSKASGSASAREGSSKAKSSSGSGTKKKGDSKTVVTGAGGPTSAAAAALGGASGSSSKKKSSTG